MSSTSVYGDDNDFVSEETITNPETESGKQLLLAEALLQNNKNFETTILRFGGLIGEDRHPVKFLAGKENLENPDTPINLIHLYDCISIIKEIINQSKWNEVFNAVAPFHPSREEYYTQKAIETNLPEPKFSTEKSNIKRLFLAKNRNSFKLSIQVRELLKILCELCAKLSVFAVKNYGNSIYQLPFRNHQNYWR